MFRYLIPVAVLSSLSVPAFADDFPIYRVEANVGWDHVRGKLDYQDSANPGNDFRESRNTDGAVFGGTVGVDVPVATGYVGVEGSVDFSSNKKCEAVFGSDSACFRVKRTIALGARFGMPVNKSVLGYVGAAWVNGRARFSYTGQTNAANDFAYSHARDGWRLSAGAEVRLQGNMFTKIEYRYSDFKNYTVAAGTESASLGFDRHQIVVGAGVRF